MTDDKADAKAILTRTSSRYSQSYMHPDCISNALKTVREHLGMEVAFISALTGSARKLTHVDTSLKISPIVEGQIIPLSDGYCQKVLDGRLPQLIPDTSRNPLAASLPDTALLPIGSHMSVPIIFADGTVYGTFCCFSSTPDLTLNDRDLRFLKAVAALVAFHLEGDIAQIIKHYRKLDRIAEAIVEGQPTVLYQPVFDIQTGRVVGAEALGRFSSEPKLPPDRWFNDADDVGLRSELETAAIRNAMAGFLPMIDRTDLYLAVNVGPVLSVEGSLDGLFSDFPPDRLVIEITEHDAVKDYRELAGSLAALRARGARIAADDVGSGFANMRHVLQLQPDYVKLDISVTDAVHEDQSQRALVTAMMEFSRHTEIKIVAEGIESAVQLDTLKSLGVQFGQGYHLGRPGTIEQLEAIA